MQRKIIDSAVILVIAIVVIAYAYFVGFSPSCCASKIEIAKNDACTKLIRQRPSCNTSTDSISVNYDANKDGVINNKDTFFELCKNDFKINTDSECKRVCGCAASESVQENSSLNSTNQTVLNQSLIKTKSFDIKVDSLTKNVNPGEYLEYVVTIYNLNNSTRSINTSINYTMKSVDSSNLIAKNDEHIIINRTLTFNREILIPSNTKPGIYVIEAIANYENSLAVSVSSFNITQPS
jgi:hypothetical protein